MSVLRVTLVAVVAVLVLRLDVSYLVSGFELGPRVWSDYLQDYASAREWRAGGDPFARADVLIERHLSESYGSRGEWRNPHTPLQIVLLAPLSALGFPAARALLVAVSVVALAVAIVLYCRARGHPAWIALAIFGLPVVHYELFMGQVMSLLTLLFVLGWRRLDAGREASAGVILGLATAIKVFPILFLPFLLRKHRRAAGWFLGSTALFSLVGAAAVGLPHSWTWLTHGSPANLEIWADYPLNVSLAGYAARIFNGWSPVIGLAVAGLALLMVSRRDFWGATPWLILGSPIAWAHYAVLVIPSALELSPGALFAVITLLSVPLLPPYTSTVPMWMVSAALLFLAFRPDKVRWASTSVEPAGRGMPRPSTPSSPNACTAH